MTVARLRLTASESLIGAPPVAGSSKSGATSPTSSTVKDYRRSRPVVMPAASRPARTATATRWEPGESLWMQMVS
jgi:hypothetical protein